MQFVIALFKKRPGKGMKRTWKSNLRPWYLVLIKLIDTNNNDCQLISDIRHENERQRGRVRKKNWTEKKKNILK